MSVPGTLQVSEPAPFGGSARAVLLGWRVALFSVVAFLCCVGSATHRLRGPAIVPVVMAAVAVAMWHGAYDRVQAEQLLHARLGRAWLPWFLSGYLVLAAVTFLGWWLMPAASLVLFLAYSAWHFGTEPEGWTPRPTAAIAALALGAVPLAAACRWHPATVMPIFAQMLYRAQMPGREAAAVTRGLASVYWPVVLLALAGIGFGRFGADRRRQACLAFVLGVAIALFLLCDPLVAFAVYFCCWHTPEHLVTTSMPAHRRPSLWTNLALNLRAGFVPWVLSLAGLGLVFALGRHQAAAYQAELFVALSVLTVPHMGLNELGRAQVTRRLLGVTMRQESGSA